MIATSSGAQTSTKPTIQLLKPAPSVSTVDLGVIHQQHLLEDVVSGVHQYSFSTQRSGELNIFLGDRLDPQNSCEDVKISLSRNINRNGVFNSEDIISESQPISFGAFGSGQYIGVPGLGGGNYLLRIEQMAPGQTDYGLKISFKPGRTEGESGSTNSLQEACQLDDNGRIWLNGTRFVDGSFYAYEAEDTEDFFRFQLKTASYFTAAAKNYNCEVELTLLSADAEVLLRSQTHNKSQFMYSDCLAPGIYYLKVTQTRGKTDSREATYRLRLSADPVTQAELMVMVRHIQAIDNFDEADQSQADFYPEVTIDGVTHKRKVILNQDDSSPHYRVSQNVSIDKMQIPITISIYDSDGSSDGSSDDHADIHPRQGERDLQLFYNPATGKVSSRDLDVHQAGADITVQGLGDDHRALVTFQIHYRAFR